MIFTDILSLCRQPNPPIEKIAFRARTTYAPRSGRKPRVDLLEILRHLEVRHDALSDQDLGLLAVRDMGGRPVLLVLTRPSLQEHQQRFVLAHQVAHILLEVHPKIASEGTTVMGLRETTCPMSRYENRLESATDAGRFASNELRADQLAAALLLPRSMLERAWEKTHDPVRIAAAFDVSSKVLTRRLEDVGLITQPPANFLEAEARLARTTSLPIREVQPKTQRASAEAKVPSSPSPTEGPRHGIPRSFAAQRYAQTQKETAGASLDATDTLRSAPPAPGAASSSTSESSPRPGPLSPRGMERIRELARRLDKSIS